MKIQHDKVWFTSDLHFWHKNICKYCNRPYETIEEMNQGIIDNWNSIVKEDDTVFVLGDLGFCGIEKLRPLMSQLKGRIILIQGNHDSDYVISTLYHEKIINNFDRLMSITIIGDEECPNQELTLCHFPMIDWYNKEKGSWMIHGHQHQLPKTPSCSAAHYDVGVDKNNWTPISFEQLKIKITQQFLNLKNNENIV
jgi:calcineurin-like phosphoesterase family protein